ncbi:MAG: hemin uptake protein HemP [Chromatiales bacterium]|nr:hemin uptake protein HemP [Chromatiales bacterium]
MDQKAKPADSSTYRGDKALRRVSSEVLFKESSRMIIEHQGANYTLQITRNGKLILTK